MDGWWFGKGLMKVLLTLSGTKASLSTYDPRTIEDRRGVAADCAEAIQFGVKTYVDEIDDKVNQDYAAWPTRLYLIDKKGVVAYAGGLGPFGFRPAELKRAIEKHLTKED